MGEFAFFSVNGDFT